ncbi:MAG: ankyrin repeat domain-containing protein [Rickettsiaceae bacterium]|nr:ankyrin repeat domain-containing protein [Rickettsiaceae bacterium]
MILSELVKAGDVGRIQEFLSQKSFSLEQYTSALFEACRREDNLLEVIIGKRNIGKIINTALSDDGYSLAATAARYGSLNNLKRLSSLGANLSTNGDKSPIYVSSTNGHYKIVHYLTNIKVFEISTEKLQIISTAAQNGHLKIVKHLINAAPSITLKECAQLINIATEEGHYKISKHLIDSLNIELKDLELKKLITLSIKHRDLKMVMLLNKVFTPEEKAESLDILLKACESKNIEIVNLLMSQEAYRINHNSALLLCCKEGYTNIAEILINSGANLSIKDNDEIGLFENAAKNGHTEILKLLLSHTNYSTEEYISAINFAHANGHRKTIEFLVQNYNVDFSALNFPILASYNWSYDFVKIIVATNPNVDTKNEEGQTALFKTFKIAESKVANIFNNLESYNQESNKAKRKIIKNELNKLKSLSQTIDLLLYKGAKTDITSSNEEKLSDSLKKIEDLRMSLTSFTSGPESIMFDFINPKTDFIQTISREVMILIDKISKTFKLATVTDKIIELKALTSDDLCDDQQMLYEMFKSIVSNTGVWQLPPLLDDIQKISEEYLPKDTAFKIFQFLLHSQETLMVYEASIRHLIEGIDPTPISLITLQHAKHNSYVTNLQPEEYKEFCKLKDGFAHQQDDITNEYYKEHPAERIIGRYFCLNMAEEKLAKNMYENDLVIEEVLHLMKIPTEKWLKNKINTAISKVRKLDNDLYLKIFEEIYPEESLKHSGSLGSGIINTGSCELEKIPQYDIDDCTTGCWYIGEIYPPPL